MSEVAVTETTGQQLEQIARDTDLDRMARLGLWFAAASGGSSEPKAQGMAAALKIAWAESLGLASYGASEVHLIKTKSGATLTLSAKAFRALAWKHGIRVLPENGSREACTAVVVDRSGKELGRTTWTIEMARERGLLSRPGENWKTMPDRMLWARASKQALDDFAPWVTVGVMSTDEAWEVVDAEPFEDGD